jgi:hypothetical protein
MINSFPTTKTIVVFPLHNPEGGIFPHLEAILPDLKQVFSTAYVSVTPITEKTHPEQIDNLERDGFFTLFRTSPEALVGDQFVHLYREAALAAPSAQVLHLCFIDRLAFILQSSHKRQFTEDIKVVDGNTPIIFSRSALSWESHPSNYRDTEQFVTRVGELLFGQILDFAWCHLAMRSSQLRKIIDRVSNHDLSMLADIVIAVKDVVRMHDVDWLEWEQPFLLHRDTRDLKREREMSIEETEKRLAYTIPMVQTLMRSIPK